MSGTPMAKAASQGRPSAPRGACCRETLCLQDVSRRVTAPRRWLAEHLEELQEEREKGPPPKLEQDRAEPSK